MVRFEYLLLVVSTLPVTLRNHTLWRPNKNEQNAGSGDFISWNHAPRQYYMTSGQIEFEPDVSSPLVYTYTKTTPHLNFLHKAHFNQAISRDIHIRHLCPTILPQPQEHHQKHPPENICPMSNLHLFLAHHIHKL